MAHFGGIITSYDSRWSIPTARSILREGNTDLNEYGALLEADHYYMIEVIDGRYYSIFPVGVSLLALPVVYALDAAGRSMPFGKTEKLVASLATALAALVLYGVARRRLDLGRALLLTFVFAFCTPAWSVGSRALWQHGPSMLMLALALWLIVLAETRPWLIQLVSLPLAFAYVIRPTNAISIVALSLFVLLRHRRFFVPYLLWALPIAVPFLVFMFSVYHSPLSWYYSAGRVGHGQGLGEALVGNLVSPNRGLFVFSPVLLLSLYGVWLKLRRRPEPLDGFLIAIVLVHWGVVSSFPHWYGGHTFGNRMMSDLIPYFMYFFIPVLAAGPGPRRPARTALVTLFVLLVVVSGVIHYRGAYRRAVWKWNSTPVDVADQPSRMWDVRDLQFLR